MGPARRGRRPVLSTVFPRVATPTFSSDRRITLYGSHRLLVSHSASRAYGWGGTCEPPGSPSFECPGEGVVSGWRRARGDTQQYTPTSLTLHSLPPHHHHHHSPVVAVAPIPTVAAAAALRMCGGSGRGLGAMCRPGY